MTNQDWTARARNEIASLERAIEMMTKGIFGTFKVDTRGKVDTTQQSIAQCKDRIAIWDRLISSIEAKPS